MKIETPFNYINTLENSKDESKIYIPHGIFKELNKSATLHPQCILSSATTINAAPNAKRRLWPSQATPMTDWSLGKEPDVNNVDGGKFHNKDLMPRQILTPHSSTQFITPPCGVAVCRNSFHHNHSISVLSVCLTQLSLEAESLFVFGVRSLMNLFTERIRTRKGSIIFQQVHPHSEYLRKEKRTAKCFSRSLSGNRFPLQAQTLISDLAVSLDVGFRGVERCLIYRYFYHSNERRAFLAFLKHTRALL